MDELQIRHKLDLIEMNYKDIKEALLYRNEDEFDDLNDQLAEADEEIMELKLENQRLTRLTDDSQDELDRLRDEINTLNEKILAYQIQIRDISGRD